jgi:hypothetical protein
MAKAMSTDLSADGRAITANALKCGPGVPERRANDSPVNTMVSVLKGLSVSTVQLRRQRSIRARCCLAGNSWPGLGQSSGSVRFLNVFGSSFRRHQRSSFIVGGYGVVPFHKRTRRGPKTAQENDIYFNNLSGAANRTRTCDPVITNDVLYQLSYCGGPNGALRNCLKTRAPDIGQRLILQEKRASPKPSKAGFRSKTL